MPPEEKPSQVAPETAVQGDEWDGPWGSISPVQRSIETLCIQIESEAGKPRIYYYPYRTIGKWNWNMDRPAQLADALNLGQLRLVQLNQPADFTGEICVQSILLEDIKN